MMGCECDKDGEVKDGEVKDGDERGTDSCPDELTEEQIEQNPYLHCIAWSGREEDLPRGSKLPRGVTARYLAKDWDVEDVLDLEVDEAKVAKVESRYGDRAIEIGLAGTNKSVSRREWADKYKTDGLLLYLIREKLRELYGGGVQVNGRTINRPPSRF